VLLGKELGLFPDLGRNLDGCKKALPSLRRRNRLD